MSFRSYNEWILGDDKRWDVEIKKVMGLEFGGIRVI